MVIWGDVFFDRKKKNIMKLRTGWLALAFFVTVSAVGVGTWYHQSHKNNLAPSTPVQKIEKKHRAEKPTEKPAEMPTEKEGFVGVGHIKTIFPAE